MLASGLNQTNIFLWQLTEQRVAEIKKTLTGTVIDYDNSDYLYLTKNLASLEGSKYRRVRQYWRRYENRISYKEINNFVDSLRIAKEWLVVKGKTPDLLHEFEAINRAINFFYELPIEGLEFYNEDVLVGFTIFERCNTDNYTLIHFCKYNFKLYPGLIYFMMKILAGSVNTTYLNFEQDLGIQGLRQLKTSLKPDKFIYRYKD